MQKILIFSLPFYPSIGGVQSTSRTLAKALVELGYQTTVVTATKLSETDTELNEGYRIVRSINGMNLLSLSVWADLIIVKGGVSVFGTLSAWVTGKPYLIYHEMLGSYLYPGHSFKAFLSNPLRQKLVDNAIAHIGVSKSCLISKALTENQLQFAIYNPVNPTLEAIAAQSKNNQIRADYDILFVGRIIEAKGIYVLGNALKLLDQQKLSLTVCFVGTGEIEQLKKFLRDCSSVKINFVGILEGESLANIYAKSRLLVIPSSTHPEGMGLVIAEAFMFNLPVIGSGQPAIEEVINNKELIFENGSAKELAAKLKSILFDRKLYQKYQYYAFEQKKKFTYDQYLGNIKSCLKIIQANL